MPIVILSVVLLLMGILIVNNFSPSEQLFVRGFSFLHDDGEGGCRIHQEETKHLCGKGPENSAKKGAHLGPLNEGESDWGKFYFVFQAKTACAAGPTTFGKHIGTRRCRSANLRVDCGARLTTMTQFVLVDYIPATHST